MTERERELLSAWLVNEDLRLEGDLIEAKNRIRYRRSDISDLYDLLSCMQRYDDFRDFALILIRLLNLDQGRK